IGRTRLATKLRFEPIGFLQLQEMILEFCRLIHEDQKESFCRRVQCPTVTGARSAELPFSETHTIKGSDPCRFVEEEKPGKRISDRHFQNGALFRAPKEHPELSELLQHCDQGQTSDQAHV